MKLLKGGGFIMPQKLTIEYVKKFVESESNGKCNVIDDVYVNDREN